MIFLFIFCIMGVAYLVKLLQGFNHQNVLAEAYNPETKSMEEYTMTGFIPVFNYRLEF